MSNSKIRVCSIARCDRPMWARTWCAAHYYRWRVHGSPNGGHTTERGDCPRFFQESLLIVTNECILWPFALSHGYAVMGGPDRTILRLHILACVHANGPAPLGKEAAHECGNAACINGRHLTWKTHLENQADLLRHGTLKRGSDLPQSKLTESDVLSIRQRRANGETQSAIARDFKVAPSTVSEIVNRKKWAWLSEPDLTV